MAPTLLIVGSGPGIGRATASLFAARQFSSVVLISRNAARLAEDREVVIDAATVVGRDVQVTTFAQDIGETAEYKKVLKQVEGVGEVTCVLFNAARVFWSDMFEFEESEIIKDFVTTNIGLYTTARWAIPLLSAATHSPAPAFLVTAGLLWKHPFVPMFSLSMVKSSQRNLVHSFQMLYPDLHIAMLNVGEPVSDEKKQVTAKNVAEAFWKMYYAKKSEWAAEVPLLEENSSFTNPVVVPPQYR